MWVMQIVYIISTKVTQQEVYSYFKVTLQEMYSYFKATKAD